jgi:hypothetical protein
MKLENIETTYARRTDWEEDKFMARFYDGQWKILSNGTFLNDREEKRCTLAYDSDKWSASDALGNFIDNVA